MLVRNGLPWNGFISISTASFGAFMISSVDGRETDLSRVFAKAPEPIFVKPYGSSTSSRAVDKKAYSPISFKPYGSSTSSRAVNEKAESPISSK